MQKAGLWPILVAIIVAVALVPTMAVAQPTHDATRSEIENLKKRIAALEKDEVELDEPFSLWALGKRIDFGGLLELEGSWHKSEGGDESSDLQLATIELYADVAINDNIGGHLSLLWEEGETESMEVDQAVILLRHPYPVWGMHPTFAGGKMYLPFGNFESVFITDPLTLELGETNQTAVVLGVEGDFAVLRVGVFNGEVDTVGDDDSIDSWVASFDIIPAEGLSMGVSYLSDLAESDIGLVTDADLYTSSVDGIAFYGTWEMNAFVLQAEYVAALRGFSADVVAAGEDLTGKRPQAWNVELAWLPAERWQLGVKAEGAKDFQDDLQRYGGVVSRGLFRSTVLALEYLYGDSDAEKSHSVMAQLAFQF